MHYEYDTRSLLPFFLIMDELLRKVSELLDAVNMGKDSL